MTTVTQEHISLKRIPKKNLKLVCKVCTVSSFSLRISEADYRFGFLGHMWLFPVASFELELLHLLGFLAYLRFAIDSVCLRVSDPVTKHRGPKKQGREGKVYLLCISTL